MSKKRTTAMSARAYCVANQGVIKQVQYEESSSLRKQCCSRCLARWSRLSPPRHRSTYQAASQMRLQPSLLKASIEELLRHAAGLDSKTCGAAGCQCHRYQRDDPTDPSLW